MTNSVFISPITTRTNAAARSDTDPVGLIHQFIRNAESHLREMATSGYFIIDMHYPSPRILHWSAHMPAPSDYAPGTLCIAHTGEAWRADGQPPFAERWNPAPPIS